MFVNFLIFRQYFLTNVRNKRKIKNSKNSNLISACRVSMTWRLYKMMKDDEWSWSAYKMFIFFSVELFLDKYWFMVRTSCFVKIYDIYIFIDFWLLRSTTLPRRGNENWIWRARCKIKFFCACACACVQVDAS